MTAPVEIAHADGTGGSSVNSLAANYSTGLLAGDLLWLCVYASSSFGAITLTSAGDGTNTLTAREAVTTMKFATGVNLSAVASGTAFTVQISSPKSNWGWVLYRYPGLASAAYDVGVIGALGSSQTPSSGNTASVAGGAELAIGAVLFEDSTGSSAWSITTAGFTPLTARSFKPGSIFFGVLPAYQEINSASGAYSLAGNDTVAPTGSQAGLDLFKNAFIVPDPFPAGYGHPFGASGQAQYQQLLAQSRRRVLHGLPSWWRRRSSLWVPAWPAPDRLQPLNEAHHG